MIRSFSIGECWSNHSLMLSKVSPVCNNCTPPTQRIDVKMLNNIDNLKSFQTLYDSWLANIRDSADFESTWRVFKSARNEEALGYVRRKPQDLV